MLRVRLKHWKSMSLRWPRCCAALSRECSGSRPLAWCPATSLRCQVSPLPQYRLANVTCSLRAETRDRHGHWKQPQSEQPPTGLCDIGVVMALDMGLRGRGFVLWCWQWPSSALCFSLRVCGLGVKSFLVKWRSKVLYKCYRVMVPHTKIAHGTGWGVGASYLGSGTELLLVLPSL